MIVQTTDDIPEDRAVEVLDVGLERPRAQRSCLLSQKVMIFKGRIIIFRGRILVFKGRITLFH